MPLSIWFWVFYVLGIVFGLWSNYVPGQPYPWPRSGALLLTWILIGLLGWQVFGSAVK